MKKAISMFTALIILVCTLCVSASAAETCKTSFVRSHGIVPCIGTPIAAFALDSLTEASDVLAELDKLSAEAGYETRADNDTLLRWYTTTNEGIIHNVFIGNGYVLVSSLDTSSDFPCGGCIMFRGLICMDGTAAWDMDSGVQLFI